MLNKPHDSLGFGLEKLVLERMSKQVGVSRHATIHNGLKIRECRTTRVPYFWSGYAQNTNLGQKAYEVMMVANSDCLTPISPQIQNDAKLTLYMSQFAFLPIFSNVREY